jgi:hypothetical protein
MGRKYGKNEINKIKVSNGKKGEKVRRNGGEWAGSR